MNLSSTRSGVDFSANLFADDLDFRRCREQNAHILDRVTLIIVSAELNKT
jgi:hypothetical protein